MSTLGINITSVKSTWSPFSASVNGIYSRILQNASTFATIISPTEISGYAGDIIASDSTFALSSIKQGVTITLDMSTWAYQDAALYMIFASADPSAGGGVVITPDVTPGQYTISIGDIFNGSTTDITAELSPTDKITVALDNTGSAGVTTYFYKNGTLLGSHEHVTPPTATIDTFVVLLACPSAITVTADMDYAVSGVTNYAVTSSGSEVDPTSYPVNPKRNAYEIVDLEGPMTITGLGTINNFDIVIFGENAEPILIIKSTVESLTSSSSAIVVDNTDPLNPVLSVKADGSSSDYLNASGTYTSVPVTSIAAGTDISVTESPTGTFTIANTQTVPVQSLVAGTNISVTESPTGTFTIANTQVATDILTSSITDDDTTHAPNGNAVYDALAFKLDAASPSFGTSLSGTLALHHPTIGVPSINISTADLAARIIASTPDVITYPSVAPTTIYLSTNNNNNSGKVAEYSSSISIPSWHNASSVTMRTDDLTLSKYAFVSTRQDGKVLIESTDGINVVSNDGTLTLQSSNANVYINADLATGFITADAYTIDLTATTAIHLNGPNVLANGSHIETLDKHVTTISSISGVVTIDLSAGYSHYILNLTENVTSWVFTNVPASGYFKEIYITIIQHASSAKTVVSPATSGRTAGGIVWIADTTLSSRELLVAQFNSDSTVDLFPTGAMV